MPGLQFPSYPGRSAVAQDTQSRQSVHDELRRLDIDPKDGAFFSARKWRWYPLVMTNIAIENDHRNSGFSHWKWWFSISYVKLPEGNDGCVRGRNPPCHITRIITYNFHMMKNQYVMDVVACFLWLFNGEKDHWPSNLGVLHFQTNPIENEWTCMPLAMTMALWHYGSDFG